MARCLRGDTPVASAKIDDRAVRCQETFENRYRNHWRDAESAALAVAQDTNDPNKHVVASLAIDTCVRL
jgi:hypothetical protein